MARVSERSRRERFQFVKENGDILGIRYLCDLLEVSFQGFYKWRDRSEPKRISENRELAAKIERIYLANDGNYGSPRVHAKLREDGELVNHKRVERLMRDAGLVGKAAKLYRRKAVAGRFFMKYPNLRLDLGVPTEINQQWAGDITYLKVAGEWRYLAIVMDLYSRRIIGWSLGCYKNAELTRSALLKALSHRKVKKGLIFHTDRGQEYGAHLIQDELSKVKIASSMSRPDSLTDNIQVESFFRTLKTECYHGVSYENEHELRMALSYYLDNYYNERRIHTSIGFKAPVQYEKQAA